MNKTLPIPRADFIGWQEDFLGADHFPLFNVVWPSHPLDGSTVDANTILRIGLSIPSDMPKCPYKENSNEIN